MAWYKDKSEKRQNAANFENSTLPEIGVTSRLVSNADYTLTNADHGRYVYMADNTTARVVTVPTELQEDFTCGIIRWGSAAVSIAPASGVELRSIQNFRAINAQYGFAGIAAVEFSAETYYMTGHLA